MFLVGGRVRRRLAVGLGSCLALASVGPGVAIACEGAGEEIPLRVLTVEKAGGPEADVGDTVKAVLYAGTKSQFITGEGEIACAKSEMAGEITSNPVSGIGKAEIKLEAFTFRECETNIPGLTIKGVAIETFPLIAVTVGTTGFNITENGINFSVELTVESGGEERVCVVRASPGSLSATYRNNNDGEIEIEQKLSGFFNKRNCGGGFPEPTWKAKYRPLRDESRAEKQIFIN